MDMIERVARALCERHRNPDTLVPGVVVTDHGALGMSAAPTGPLEPAWHGYRSEARAAIEAMREPTEAMRSAAGTLPISYDDGHDTDDVWRTMIEAALTPKQP